MIGAWLTACASTPIAPASDIETLPEAITIPYRISGAGRILVDIAVNDHPARPFAVDTGATVSVIYDDYMASLEIAPNSQTVIVRGLVAVGARPIIEDVEFKIGPQKYLLDRVAVLETPVITDEAVGLLGTDVLAGYTAMFNKDNMTATFVLSEYVNPKYFIGWREIPLHKKVGSQPDVGLYFAKTFLKKKNIPVLVDTGSNLNFVNWRLAVLDEDIRKIERKLRKKRGLRGALKTSALTKELRLYGFALSRHYWPDIPATVMELDPLGTVAPIDRPMMIAGANMFTPWSVAFDFGGQALYIRPNPDDPRPPIQRDHYKIETYRE